MSGDASSSIAAKPGMLSHPVVLLAFFPLGTVWQAAVTQHLDISSL